MLLQSFLSVSVFLSSLSGFAAANDRTDYRTSNAKGSLQARAPTANGLGQRGSTLYRASITQPTYSGFSRDTASWISETTIMGYDKNDVIQRAMSAYKQPNARWYLFHIDANDPLLQWGLQSFRNPNQANAEIYRPGTRKPSYYAQAHGFTRQTAAENPNDPVLWGAGYRDKDQMVKVMGALNKDRRWFLFTLKRHRPLVSSFAKTPRLPTWPRETLAAETTMSFDLVTSWEVYDGENRIKVVENTPENLKLW
ncbi:hypothetical protein MCOR33_001131 [Pyricularia grisea]|uniref:Uncharacterized protein n=1 Tax=Pyricularia grisea TaxID=148305 RepID=A0ABQ8NZG2_PYRGI|nr:hypothetical protein MCOR33_001131 [Pyricularia grisea]